MTKALILLSLLLSAAIFGFFFAWVCSTMWGLDRTDPRIAMEAMQAMNASVRNWVFAPAFFGTPVILALTAAWLWFGDDRGSAGLFALAAAIYLTLGLVLTMTINVPMNEALAEVSIPGDIEEARAIWQAYSGRWQVWNQIRTVASGLAFVVAVLGALRAARHGA